MSKVHDQSHKFDHGFKNKCQRGYSVFSDQRYICIISPTSHRIGNRSDEALFTKCCVHGIPLVFSLVWRGEFLSGPLSGLPSRQDRGKVVAQATWSQYGVIPTKIGRHLAYELQPTVTRGWSDPCSRSNYYRPARNSTWQPQLYFPHIRSFRQLRDSLACLNLDRWWGLGSEDRSSNWRLRWYCDLEHLSRTWCTSKGVAKVKTEIHLGLSLSPVWPKI